MLTTLVLVGDDVVVRRATAGPVIRIRDVRVNFERLTVTGGSGASGHGIDCTGTEGSYLQMEGIALTVEGNAGTGILADGCAIGLYDSAVVGNGGDGVRVTGTDAGVTVTGTVVRDNGGVGLVAEDTGIFGALSSYIQGNAGGGVQSSVYTAVVSNVVVTGNGNLVDSAIGGMSMAAVDRPGSFADHVTVADNRTAGGAIAGIECPAPMPISNSIVWGNEGDDSQVGAECWVIYTLVSGPVPTGAGNLAGDPAFVDPPADYDIGAGSDAIDRGDPAGIHGGDIHGDPRGEGADADLGADEYVR